MIAKKHAPFSAPGSHCEWNSSNKGIIEYLNSDNMTDGFPGSSESIEDDLNNTAAELIRDILWRIVLL